jgi:alanine-synthesizing transaminase
VGESSYAAAVREARASGGRIYDLTVSNPTRCGFAYDAEALLRPLADPRALVYDPDPRGMRSAREAVAGYYAGHGADITVDNLVLTTSTSESYSFLFRLLCDAGDEVLVAQPSYPLFDFLADLDDVRLRAVSAVLRPRLVDRRCRTGACDHAADTGGAGRPSQ